MLTPIQRRSLSDAVFDQLRDAILSGQLAPGSTLPSERQLCEQLGVNRGAVREALKRLAQARLIATHHGGATRVLDYRKTGGLDLLPALLTRRDGSINLPVLRSVVEMRSALAPDVARLAAKRSNALLVKRMEEVVAEMRQADGIIALQILSLRFWDVLIEGSQNLAYRLAFNALRDLYSGSMEALSALLAAEVSDVAGLTALTEAVRQGDGPAAAQAASQHVALGLASFQQLIQLLSAQTEPLKGDPS